MDKPSSLVLAIMAKKARKPGHGANKPDISDMSSDDDMDYDMDSMGSEAAAEELIHAIKSGDASGVMEAFKSLMAMCKDKSEEEY